MNVRLKACASDLMCVLLVVSVDEPGGGGGGGGWLFCDLPNVVKPYALTAIASSSVKAMPRQKPPPLPIMRAGGISAIFQQLLPRRCDSFRIGVWMLFFISCRGVMLRWTYAVVDDSSSWMAEGTVMGICCVCRVHLCFFNHAMKRTDATIGCTCREQ